VAFDANVFLLKKESAEKLLVPAPAVPAGGEGSPATPAEPPKSTGGALIPSPAAGVVAVRLSGEVPPELWNKVGIKLIPKLRSTNGLRIEVVMTGNVDGSSAASFVDDVKQAITDLDLQGKLNVTRE